MLKCAVNELPEIQRRRFLLYFEFGYNLRKIGEMEGYGKTAIQKSVYIAREKVKRAIENYRYA